jgi:glycosyltransferase involved in cell wall biosynthesis
VTFISPTPENRKVFGLADIFVDPSADRTMRITGLQALAAGLAVVAAEGGVADHYKENATALVYPPVSPETLRRHLLQLLGDRDGARQMARQGQDYVRTHYRASQMASQLAEIYCKLASGDSPRA